MTNINQNNNKKTQQHIKKIKMHIIKKKYII